MALSADGRITLSAAGQLSGATASLAGKRLVKFCNGELMGKKLKLKLKMIHLQKGVKNNVRPHVCMTLTTNVAGEAKLRDLEMEKRDPRTVVAIILGGGASIRLFPLTKSSAKPAVPIGGSYRLIDVPMSNCINSGINKVYILTQFNSASLNRHLTRAYNLGAGVTFGDGFVKALAATQTLGKEGKRWFQGTADTVRQFHWLFEDERSKDTEDVVILSGDHLYRMDYMDFVQNHRQSGADITLSCLPMDYSRASDFGLMKIDGKGRVMSFSEKPKGDDLKAMAVDTTVLGLSREEAKKKPYIASMGVWRFPTANDFGPEIIPASAKEFLIKAYLFNDYWEDIGTIRSFLKQTLLLLHIPRDLVSMKPMYTSRRNLPPTTIDNIKVEHSVVGIRLPNALQCALKVQISFRRLNMVIICSVARSYFIMFSKMSWNMMVKQDTVMLGADNYETDAEIAAMLAEGRVPIGIGENTRIRDCIIDKNARIGKNVVIANLEGIQEADRSSEGFYIRSGITIILKNSTIKDGVVI
ncbi:hypothetical protein ACSBR2_013389 [Camellia fascicularis]